MAGDIRERFINPYTDFGFLELFDQAEIGKYSDTVRRQYEESKKMFWDNYSVLKTAKDKGIQQGIQEGLREGAQKEKEETARRLQSMGLAVEQIAQGADLSIDEVKKLLQ